MFQKNTSKVLYKIFIITNPLFAVQFSTAKKSPPPFLPAEKSINIEDIRRWREDMNIIFEW